MRPFVAVALVVCACDGRGVVTAGATTPCGLRTDDWCPAPAGDPCGAHRGAADCEADARCEAVPYRGESLEACIRDARCFSRNCPAVGCVSRCEALDADACGRDARRCALQGGRCARATGCAQGPRGATARPPAP